MPVCRSTSACTITSSPARRMSTDLASLRFPSLACFASSCAWASGSSFGSGGFVAVGATIGGGFHFTLATGYLQLLRPGDFAGLSLRSRRRRLRHGSPCLVKASLLRLPLLVAECPEDHVDRCGQVL